MDNVGFNGLVLSTSADAAHTWHDLPGFGAIAGEPYADIALVPDPASATTVYANLIPPSYIVEFISVYGIP